MKTLEGLPRKIEGLEKSRELYEETARQEKAYANDLANTFIYKGIREGIEKFRTALTPEEIIENDARRINELKDRAKSGTLTSEEKEELELRQSSDLFMRTFVTRHTGYSIVDKEIITDELWARLYAKRSKEDENFPSIDNIKEYFYPANEISGTVKGKKVALQRTTYPVFSLDALTEESRDIDSFYMSEWQGPVRYEYGGNVDDGDISEAGARKLFERYAVFASKRTEELKKLKAEKEIAKYGHVIEGGESESLWRVEEESK